MADQIFLQIKAKVPRIDIQQTVIDLVIGMIEKMTGEKYRQDLIPKKIKTLNNLFESKNLPEIYEKGDSPLMAGDNPLEEGRNYQFRWEQLKTNGYLFQLEAKASGTNEKAIKADFKEAGNIICGYFKAKGLAYTKAKIKT